MQSLLTKLRTAIVAGLALVSVAASAQVNVLTYHNDFHRDGLNNQETILTKTSVNPNAFGLLFTLPVDGQVYAQPLYMSNVAIPNQGTHNVVIVCTENNSVYAFDANTAGHPLWHINFGQAVPNGDTGTDDINPQIGITGTPVIVPGIAGVWGGDPVLYVVPKTKGGTANTAVYTQTLYVVDVTSGAVKGHVVIGGSVAGTGDGTNGKGQVPFNTLIQNQRPALLYLPATAYGPSVNTIYIAWASHGDNGPYHGWIMAYNAQTLAQTGILNTSPNATTDPSGYPLAAGGIWQGGAGLASDGVYLYGATGNGTFNPANGSYGDSVFKVPSSSFKITDYFSPSEQQTLDDYDEDLGSGGLVVIPGVTNTQTGKAYNLLVQSGKEGSIYLLNSENLGKNNPTDTVYQELPQAIGGIWGQPAYWNGNVYFGPIYSSLVAFKLSGGVLTTSPTSQGPKYYNYPGPTPSVSSNGTANGIVWAVEGDNYSFGGPATLQAYDATNLANELYDSGATNGRDSMGPGVKFAVPTIANGHVFVGTGSELDVFGLGQWAATPQLTASGAYTNSVTVTMKDATPKAQIYYTLDGSVPTPTHGTLYNGAIQFTTSETVTARAFATGYGGSAITTAYYQISPVIGNGTGLLGYYYNNSQNPSGPPTATRVDPTINFNWNGNSPITGVAGTNWAGEWNGHIQAETTSLYTFYTDSDDGVQLIVNGQTIINDWTQHAPTVDTATFQMTAGQKYTIQIKYFQAGGGSLLSLSWSAPGMAEQIVPTSQLYPNPGSQ